jgi:hypothetical protein
MKRLLTVAVSLGLFVFLALPVSAGSVPPGTPPPQLTCYPGIGVACNETDHFSEMVGFGNPLPCPRFQEWVVIDATGNGVQHITVNAAQDFWETFTLAGPGSIQLIKVLTFKFIPNPPNPPMMVPDTYTNDGLPFTGQLQQWFGASGNRNNFVFSFTTNFQGTTSTGQPVSVHINGHQNTTGAFSGIPNLNSAHFDATCS